MGWVLAVGSVICVTLLLLDRKVAMGQSGPWPLFSQADFRDTVTSPVRAMWAGSDPYDIPTYLAQHAGVQEFPLYSPGQLLLFSPLGLLPPMLAGVVWLWMQVGMLGYLCAKGLSVAGRAGWSGWRPLHLDAILPWLLTLVIWRPPGLLLLSSGQLGLPCAVGCVVAVTARYLPVQVLGVVAACLKPQVGLPLLLVLLLIRRWRAACWGTLWSAVLAAPVVALLAAHEGGIPQFVKVLTNNLRRVSQGTPTGLGSHSSRPVDVLEVASGILPHPVGMVVGALLAFMLAGCLALALRRSEVRDAGMPIVAMTAGLLVVTLTPNESYSLAVLLPGAIAVLLTDRRWDEPVRVATVVLTGVLLRPEALDRVLGIPATVTQMAPGLAVLALSLAVIWRSAATRRTAGLTPTTS